MVKITFLGTSYTLPTSKRNHTSILLTYKGENILVDCGEGTQRQLRKAKINPCKLTKILITHLHGDHVLGIPGLLQTLSLSEYKKNLFIYGPRGTKRFMKEIGKIFLKRLNYKIKVEEIEKEGKFFDAEDFFLESKKMNHGVPCNAYSFNEKGRIKIDREKLKKSKLPSSKILKRLKEGKNISYKGKKYLAKNLTFNEKGKKVSFVLDTLYEKKIQRFVKESDLLICESTFHSEIESNAREKKHLTSKQAGLIAKESKSKKLILTHISQRYEKNLKKILGDAKKKFKNSHLVKDLDVVDV
jgi:ribonuclease Z|tara:strand:- start:374 stop:1273 length:900 start_codon:yes stop_codon:yes gene_type:complete